MKKPNFGKTRREKRIRSRIKLNSQRMRLSVFRSSKHIYAQIIDDLKGKTLVSFNDKKLSPKELKNKVDIAKEVGKAIALEAKKAKIEKVVFDKGAYLYHGRVKALAEGAREGGLQF